MAAELSGGAKWGKTPLMAASGDGRKDMGTYWTPLMHAALGGHIEVAWTLLYDGAR